MTSNSTDDPGATALDNWVDQLAGALGVPRDEVDIRMLLDLARDAAHQVDRPAAPLTTFLVGYAAALRGGGAQAAADAAATARTLAAGWPHDRQHDRPGG